MLTEGTDEFNDDIDPYTEGKNWTQIAVRFQFEHLYDNLELFMKEYAEFNPHYTIRGTNSKWAFVSLRLYKFTGEFEIKEWMKMSLRDQKNCEDSWMKPNETDPKRTKLNCIHLTLLSNMAIKLKQEYSYPNEAIHLLVNMMCFQEYSNDVFQGYKDMMTGKIFGQYKDENVESKWKNIY